MTENQREAWDSGEPASRSHEEYKAPESTEPQPVEVTPGVPEPQENDHAADADAADSAESQQDLSALTEDDESSTTSGDDSSYS